MEQPKFKVGDVVRIKYTRWEKEMITDTVVVDQRLHIVQVIAEECPGGQQNHYYGRKYDYRKSPKYGMEKRTDSRLDRYNEAELEAIEEGDET